MKSRAKRKRMRIKAKKIRDEMILPTPERIAKGDVVRLPSGQMKNVSVTFLDLWRDQKVFEPDPAAEDYYSSLAIILDLTERAGLFSSATRSITALSFIDGKAEADLSAIDEWRHIVSQLSFNATKTIIRLVSDPSPVSFHLFPDIRSHVMELKAAIESFRTQKSV